MKKKASDVRQKLTPQERYGARFEMHTSMLWRQQTMKALTVALFFLALFPSFTSAKEEKWSIVRADVVLVFDQRVSDWRASPLKIIDPKLVQAITSLFLDTKGRWKKGFATSPSGDIRFIFYRGDQYLDSVGVGNRFIVRGGSGDWASMQISAELEARLRGFSEREPVQPPKTTTGTQLPILAEFNRSAENFPMTTELTSEIHVIASKEVSRVVVIPAVVVVVRPATE